MKPFIVLISVFALSLGITRIGWGEINYGLSGTIAMSCMLLLTASGHFLFAKGMELMIPPPVPFKKQLVLLTGLFEIAAAVLLLIPALRTHIAWIVIVFFVVMLPANISAAARNINYEKATTDGPGLTSLWFRVPLQLLFIGWLYFFSIWLNK